MESRERFGQGPSQAPVSVGEELDVTIEAVGEKGDGVAKKKGFVLFIPNVKAGNRVRIRVTKVFKKVGFGEVIGEAQSPPEPEQGPRPTDLPDVEPQASPQDSDDFGEEPAEESLQESNQETDENDSTKKD